MKKIRVFGDPVLSMSTTLVPQCDRSVERLAAQMCEIIKATGCAGLAANQLGVIKRVLAYDCAQLLPGARAVLINPGWSPVGERTQIATEKCLSLPGIAVEVERCYTVQVSAWDLRGRPVGMVVSGDLARLIQHATDHLDGRSVVSRLGAEQRRRVMGTVRNSRWFNQ